LRLIIHPFTNKANYTLKIQLLGQIFGCSMGTFIGKQEIRSGGGLHAEIGDLEYR
jgi:hypothetical protein